MNKSKEQPTKTTSPVPQTMKAVFLEAWDEPLVTKEVPIPTPGPGKALVKIEAAPINPADLAYIDKKNHKKLKLPLRVGFEGCGTVVSVDGGIMNHALLGRKVACAAIREPGTWAEYIVLDTQACIPLGEELSFERGACMIINPFTALAFEEIIYKEKHKAVIQSGAASALGRMVLRLLQKTDIKVINIVRNEEETKIVKSIPADNLLYSQDEDFEAKLKQKASELGATCFFDCVGGDLIGKVLKNMPAKSVCYVHGLLSHEENAKIDLFDLLVNKKSIVPFSFETWLKEQGMIKQMEIISDAEEMLDNELRTEVSKTFPLESINEAKSFYIDNMNAGKVLLKPERKSL